MRRWQAGAIGAGLTVLVGFGLLQVPQVRFMAGGAMLNLGYRFQDDVAAYDFEHEHDITPEQVWAEFQRQNALASTVREQFPRTSHHPLVAMLVCMDARIDTNDLVGDTRLHYYIVRTAGSVIGPVEGDMLDLAVNNGIKVLVLTRHTDCAAEKAAKDPVARAKYPALVAAVDERDARVDEFLARPDVAAKVASGELLVKELLIDTRNERLLDADQAVPAPPAPAH